MALPSSSSAVLLPLMLLSLLVVSAQAAQSPISLPPASAPATSDGKDSVIAPSAADEDTVVSPPGPPETSPLASPSASPAPAPAYLPSYSSIPAAPAPAPASASTSSNDGDDDEGEDGDYKKEKKQPSPAPAPAAAMEVKAGTGGGGEQVVDHGVDEERHKVDGGKKAGVVVGAFSAAAVVGLAAVVWRKRQANIRRSRYADYSARLELV